MGVIYEICLFLSLEACIFLVEMKEFDVMSGGLEIVSC